MLFDNLCLGRKELQEKAIADRQLPFLGGGGGG